MERSKLVHSDNRKERRKNPYAQDMAVIEEIRKQTDHETLFRLKFKGKKIQKDFEYFSGQFLMLSVFGVGEAPFSISSTPSRKGFLEICVRAVGSVTDALHKMKAGDVVGVRGPYGQGFPFEDMKGNDVVLIAGGIGLIPLRSLINNVCDNRDNFRNISIIYGTKSPSEILFTKELKKWSKIKGVNLHITVDEPDKAWKGKVGVVTKLLEKMEIDSDRTYVAICGPPVMYKFVVKLLEKKEVPMGRILVSLERRMECGIGKCSRCGIGYKFTCLDGPVFNYWDVMNLQEAIK